MAKNSKRVRTPLGGEFKFLTEEEKNYYESSYNEFMKRYDFEHPADLTALENLLVAQLLAYRYSKWAAEGKDYQGNKIEDLPGLLSALLNIQSKVSQLMSSLGLSRREREENLSAQEIILRIAKKAKEYGLQKNKVAWEFLVRSYRIRDVLDSYERMNEVERKKFGYTAEDCIQKIKSILKPLEDMEEEFLRERNLWKTTLRGDFLAAGETD